MTPLRPQRKNVVIWGAGLTVVLVLSIWLWLACREMQRPFSARIWQDSTNAYPDNPRKLMVDDLAANHLRIGQTLDEVEALLGPGSHRMPYDYPVTTEELWYSIGSAYGPWERFPIDLDISEMSLVLAFDENRKLYEAVVISSESVGSKRLLPPQNDEQ